MDRQGFRIVQRSEGLRGDLAQLSADAERLYWRLMLACDAHGCHRAETVTVAGNAMCGVNITVKKVEQAISELVNAGVIDTWAVGNEQWLEIVNFDLGQTANAIQRRHARVAPPRPERPIRPSDEEPPAAQLSVVPDKPPSPTDNTAAMIQQVFDHWAEGEKRTGGAQRAMLTKDRATKIRLRLDEGYTVEDLCAAIDGFHADAFHLGENKQQTRYTDIVTILKDARKVDTGIQKSGGARSGRYGTGERHLDERFSVYDK